MSEYDVRDGVLAALIDTYGPLEVQGKTWYPVKFWARDNDSYTADLCLQLTTDILALYAYAHIDPEHDHRAKYYGETMFYRVLNMLWAAFPGGGTASHAAERVGKVLGFAKEE